MKTKVRTKSVKGLTASLFIVALFLFSSFAVMDLAGKGDSGVSGDPAVAPPIAGGRLSGTVDLSQEKANQKICHTSNYAYSGTAVISGDVNGDGYDDIIIGARGASSYSGEILIFYGMTNTGAELTDANADVTISAPSGARYMGESIGVGDVDGDGIDDIVAGSMYASSYRGEAYIWFGSRNLPSVISKPDVKFIGERGYSSSSYFGTDVWVEDLDGDNVKDVIVVEPYWYERVYGTEYWKGTSAYRYYNYTGLAFIFWGRSQTEWGVNNGVFKCDDGDWDVRIKGWTPAGTSGYRYSRMGYYAGQGLGSGDMNGDGYNDIAISTGYYCYIYYSSYSSYSYTGCTWVIPGRNRTEWTQWGGHYNLLERQGDYMMFTRRSSSAYSGYNPRFGDVNGDGYDDLLIGSYRGSGDYGGYVYVIFGKADLTEFKTGTFWNQYPYGGYYNDIENVYDLRFQGEASSYLAQSWLDDFDGDGIDDILLGAGYTQNPSGDYGSGAAYLFYGRRDWSGMAHMTPSQANWTVYGEDRYNYLGYYYYQTLGSGDFNADGKADFLMGAYGNYGLTGTVYYAGATYMWLSEQPEMTPHEPEILDADGEDGMTLLPGAGGAEDKMVDLVGDGVYTIATGYNDTWTIYEGNELRLIFQLKGLLSDYRYTMAWSPANKSFYMLENPQDAVVLEVDRCEYVIESVNTVHLNFSFSINPWFLTEDPFDVIVEGENNAGVYSIAKDDFLHLEKDITFLGDDFVVTRDGEVINRGDFLAGGKPLKVTGMRVIYEGTLVSPPDDRFFVRIRDSYSRIFEDRSSSGRMVNFEIPTTVDSGIYKFSISLIVKDEYSPYMKATAVIPIFYVNLDFEGPEAPTNLRFHADGPDDPENRWDDDTEVWITWDPAYDTQQGVAGYYVDVSGETRAIQSFFITEGTSMNLTLPDNGTYTVTVYAVDDSDNVGRAVSTSIIIDMGEIFITDPFPTYHSGKWFMDTEVEVSFSIMDQVFSDHGPRLDLSTLQYKVTSEMTEAARDSIEWQDIRGYRVLSEEKIGGFVKYTLSTLVNVKESKDNYVWFRVEDEVGNVGQTVTYDLEAAIEEAQVYVDGQINWTEEEKTQYLKEQTEMAREKANSTNPARIWVDMTPITFSSATPSSDPLDDNRVTATIQVNDMGSWVDVSTIQYSVSRNGISNYGGWINIDPDVDSSTILARTVQPLLFEPGSTNYIRWRAKDVAGNGYTVSDDYAIIIKAEPVNNPPVAVISAPSMNDVFDTRETITFDAQDSSDPDLDDLQFSWVLGNRTVLSTLPTFEVAAADMGPGPHVISLYVTDGQRTVTSSISIYIKMHPDEVDTDGDGIPDGADQDDDNDGLTDVQEELMGTNPRLRDTDLDGKSDSLDPKPLNPLVVEENKDEGKVSYYTVLTLFIVLAVLILLIGSLLVLRRRSSMEKDRIERSVIAEGRIVSRYEELTGVSAPLLPQVKEMGLTLPPIAAQQVAPMKRAKELTETPSLPSKEEPPEEKKAEPMEAPAPGPAPAPEPAQPAAPEPTPEPEKKPTPKRRIRKKTAGEQAAATPGGVPTPESLTETAALPGSAKEGGAAPATTTCDLCGSTIEIPPGATTVECPLCGEKKTL